tara:strand:- start:727 stop:1902 length:1176 start_codon:yes stop_codon:yes gene_type:complete
MLAAGIEIRSASNYVFDHEDTRYLDCGGYNVFLLGHCHPEVVSAVRHQLETNPLSTRVLVNHQYASAAEALARVAPPTLDYVWLANSGTEAVEAALKVAWLGGCEHLIAMTGGYHGKTVGSLSVTGNPVYRMPYASLLPKTAFIPFGDVAALRKELDRDERSCVIIEPIQSEAGVVIPPDGYLKQVEESCRDHGAFLVVDEISTGLGRMGCWWGVSHEQVTPDALLAGKALSGGVIPVAAAIFSAEAYAPLNRDPFLHTSTFGGNPLAAVAARTTVEVIERYGLVNRARQSGEALLHETRNIFNEHCPHLINDVRGQGLLIGIEFKEEHLAAELILELMRRHIIVSHSLNSHQVVRITPSALLDDTDIHWLTEAMRESASQLAVNHKDHRQ